jgi:hypothetical protein
MDTAIIDSFPALVYRLSVECGSEDTLLRLYYDNFAGQRTEELRSSNFLITDRRIFAFGQLHITADTNDASFRAAYQITAPDRVQLTLIQRPNAVQTTRTDIFFRKDSI